MRIINILLVNCIFIIICIGRNRWVIYGNRFGWDYEGSQVPPEWLVFCCCLIVFRHRWLHHSTDETPVSKPLKKLDWYAEHSENLTLEKAKKYVPYSTTRPKIEAWKPPQ